MLYYTDYQLNVDRSDVILFMRELISLLHVNEYKAKFAIDFPNYKAGEPNLLVVSNKVNYADTGNVLRLITDDLNAFQTFEATELMAHLIAERFIAKTKAIKVPDNAEYTVLVQRDTQLDSIKQSTKRLKDPAYANCKDTLEQKLIERIETRVKGLHKSIYFGLDSKSTQQRFSLILNRSVSTEAGKFNKDNLNSYGVSTSTKLCYLPHIESVF